MGKKKQKLRSHLPEEKKNARLNVSAGHRGRKDKERWTASWKGWETNFNISFQLEELMSKKKKGGGHPSQMRACVIARGRERRKGLKSRGKRCKNGANFRKRWGMGR